jgi:hypothetical protein
MLLGITNRKENGEPVLEDLLVLRRPRAGLHLSPGKNIIISSIPASIMRICQDDLLALSQIE